MKTFERLKAQPERFMKEITVGHGGSVEICLRLLCGQGLGKPFRYAMSVSADLTVWSASSAD